MTGLSSISARFRLRNGGHTTFPPGFLRSLIVPLLLEQFLVLFVGIADTLMVSYAGEAAVSGVSLVDTINTIFIYLFNALATGCAVSVSQCLGQRDRNRAQAAAGQSALLALFVSACLTVATLLAAGPLLGFLFRRAEPAVLSAGETYLRISACSYVPLALYSVATALYRSMGRTRTTLYVSLLMNAINISGNAVGIFVLHAGVAGVAYPTLLARSVAAAVMLILCFRNRLEVGLQLRRIFSWQPPVLCGILRVAIPNGVEETLFQAAKVLLGSLMVLFGTTHIAANGVAQSFMNLSALGGIVMGYTFVTVVGRCIGAGDELSASYYVRKLLRISVLLSLACNAAVLGILALVLPLYDISPETRILVMTVMVIHNAGNVVFHSIYYPLSYGLRAAGDVRYTMVVSLISTYGVRMALSVIFGLRAGLGVVGIVLAMVCDWAFRAVCFVLRFRSGRWKRKALTTK